MTQDQIEHLARECGDAIMDARGRESFEFDYYGLARLVALVEAAERERNAALCDGIAGACDHSSDGLKRVGAINAAKSCARLIRGG